MLSDTSRNVAKMSAAGSGKTYDICKEALEKARRGIRVLVTTYTNRGAESVRKEIKSQNDGVLSQNVVVKTWFAFMLSDMIRPYQRYLTGEIDGVKGYDYSQAYGFINYYETGTKKKYLTEGNNVRSNEAASLVVLLNHMSEGKVISRIEEIYQAIYFDEIQDMAGDDIEIINLLLNSSINVICCGDNKQATFRTHNAKKNKKKTGKNIWEYFKYLEDQEIVDVERNLASRRFNRQICEFANSVFPSGDPIMTIMEEETEHDGVYLIGSIDLDYYYRCYLPQILRYDKNAETYGYHAVNYGACKGETFERVIIIPNGPFTKFIKNGTALNSPEKYYVAVTRAKYSIAVVLPKLPRSLSGYEEVDLDCGEVQIRALRYIVEDPN